MLSRFIDSFKKAVAAEMEAMRRRMGPFEVALIQGRLLEGDRSEKEWFYSFSIQRSNDKLVLGGECSLLSGTNEQLVTITGLAQDQITLRCTQPIELGAPSTTLVIYPWFLYEKLQLVLQDLVEDDTYYTKTALALFGKGPRQEFQVTEPLAIAPALNTSQQRAVELCWSRSPSFVWGPPGTGKTTTLGHIVTALLAQGQRVLLTSTTNAAVDQALTELAGLEGAQKCLESGQIVRLGQTQAETFGAGLAELTQRLNSQLRHQVGRLQERRRQLDQEDAQCRVLLAKLAEAPEQNQMDFFGKQGAPALDQQQLRGLFSPLRAQVLAALPPAELGLVLECRQRRLTRCLDLSKEKIRALSKELRQREAGVVAGARVVLATMTNVYISHLMEGERFDAVIVEEAGMAILPTLFYCAALGRTRAIMVGDPQQLPPIVQAEESFVYRAMGRSIFAVTVPKPHESDLVVLLDTQYRMHPRIGDLVGELFYAGRLRHGEPTYLTQKIADKAPFAGQPLVVVDTGGKSVCATPEGSYSRYNNKTAQACVDLALEAVGAQIESVAIITPYAEQARRIAKLLAGVGDLAGRVECRTVHRFQGGERDMVIFDTVDAAPMAPGVLLSNRAPNSTAPNLINVSLSRARGKLVIVADVQYLLQRQPDGIISTVLKRALKAGQGVSLNGRGEIDGRGN